MQASYFSSASPQGDCVVYLRETGICKQNLHRRGPAIANTAASFHHTKVTSLRWSDDGSQVLIVSDRGVKVIEVGILLDNALLNNGSGGLGKIVSADFVGNEYLLAVWEFGKTKLWHVLSGKAADLTDIKMICDGRAWQTRPGAVADGKLRLFAMLHRAGAEDHLALNFSSLNHALPPIKLPTCDAQSLSWSPDGRWLAIVDVPTASPYLHIYTPDGHVFRSYPSSKDSEPGLGVKEIAWSPEGRLLALSKYDGRVELLNTKTFMPLAVIEHSSTIDQKSRPTETQARVWQQFVSASSVRTYKEPPQPVSPPLSRSKPTTEPFELGVAEMCFSCDGRYLATRDCRMLNTVWVWEVSTLVAHSAHSVIMQHANVRKLLWHPAEPSLLLIDCAEEIATVYDVSSKAEPQMFPTSARPRAMLSWISTPRGGKTTIMATEKTTFKLIYPDGQDDAGVQETLTADSGAEFEEGASEDSLFDVLSGRKPLPPKTNPSYTEMMDLDAEAEDTVDGEQLDDTFREKRKAAERDPLDDSDFF